MVLIPAGEKFFWQIRGVESNCLFCQRRGFSDFKIY
jgi:hypothetical protein